ncbi:hypothetical protein [Paenibacillus sp. FSL E2-0178]|uniref:hypothetical protein n=1 Tax=Paenibacillus sp. FSL E2-0178 TaxID=2921361 RepID=UPI00315932C0
MSEAEVIMRRKARRLKNAQLRLSYIKSDIAHSDMDKKMKDYVLKQIDKLKLYLNNDDKEDNQWNRNR